MEATKLPKEVFGLDVSADLVQQVVVSQSSNRRINIAHTKDRSEKRGGGAKPWRQKGTGRARHGSRRSPIWKGGGITFGPRKEKNYKKKIPLVMKRKALLMVLSEKAREKNILIFNNLKVKGKTKEVVDILSKLKIGTSSCLIVLPEHDALFVKATNNIQKVSVMTAKDLNALDLMSFKYIVLNNDSIKKIKETFVK